MVTIKTREELDNWLDKYNHFEDEYVLKIDKDPFVLTLGILISGTSEAYTEEEIKSFEITPVNIFTCDYQNDFDSSSKSCIESIEIVEGDCEGVGFHISGPPYFTLIAESFTIIENETIKSIVEPWISRQDIYIEVPIKTIPKPEYFKQEFKKLGFDIVFRYYGGESKSFDVIPPDYEGFFIQLEDRLNTITGGIFIRHCTKYSMYFQQCDAELDSLWTALTMILANLPDVKISCGNCKFTGEEWKQKFDCSVTKG